MNSTSNFSGEPQVATASSSSNNNANNANAANHVGSSSNNNDTQQLHTLYVARGNQLEKKKKQLVAMSEDFEREKRIYNHQISMSKGERRTCLYVHVNNTAFEI